MAERRTSTGRRSLDRIQKSLDIEHAKLKVLQEIGRISSDGRGLDQIYNHGLKQILGITETRGGSILLVDEIRRDLVFTACIGRGAGGLMGKRIPMGDGIAGWVAQTGRSYFAEDAQKDLRHRKDFAEKTGVKTRNILCVPLKSGKKVLGVVEILNKKNGKPFDRDDLELLQAVAGQMGMVSENVQLLRKYEDKVGKLRILKEVSRVLNSTLDEAEVRRRAMDAATRLMNAETGSLLLIDPEKKELFFEVALGKKGERIREIRLSMSEGIAGHVATTGKPVIVQDVQKDPRFSRKADDKSSFKTRNMICVPVRIKKAVVGVLQAINKKGGETFTKWDLEEFMNLSDQVGVAIENANLYKELKEAFMGTAEALGDAIEAKDAYTAGHTHRVHSYSLLMGKHLALAQEDLENLRMASMLHDIGKIGVEDHILRKPGKLDEGERKKMEDHAMIGSRIVGNIRKMEKVVPGIRHHHEEFDGTGYPGKLSGGDIPIIARIISVADCFDAMTTDRPYRKGLPIQTALDEINRMKGTQFDGKVVEAFIKAYEVGDLNETLVSRMSPDRRGEG